MKEYIILPHTKGWCIALKKSKKCSFVFKTVRGAEIKANYLLKKYNNTVIYITDYNGRIIDSVSNK